jgi:urease accessory protein UreF
MKKIALFTALALALVPTAGIAFTATSASAVVDQTSAEQLVRASLAQMGVTNPDSALVASLVTELLAQQDAGTIIDTSLIDPAPTATPSDTPTPTDTAVPTVTPTPAETQGPHPRIGRHYREQSQLWALASPVWNSAFDTIRTAYDECVTANVAGVDCGATLIPDLQVAHAAALAGAYDQIVAQIATMPADQQAAAQTALDLQNTSAQKQLAHVLAEHTPIDATTGLVNTSVDKLNELQAELERKSATYRTTKPTGTPVDPAAPHRQDAEHRNANSLHTAEPTAAPESSPSATPSSSVDVATQRSGEDFAKRVRQGNHR